MKRTAELTFDVNEAAEQIGISTDTIYRLVAQGRFPAVRTGGKKSRIIIPKLALEKWLQDTVLMEVAATIEPQALPTIKERKKKKDDRLKHWYEVPGCGGRKRKEATR